jgi:hypothetical protein
MHGKNLRAHLSFFHFKNPKSDDEFPSAKSAFLHKLNSHILEPHQQRIKVKEKCFFVHDNHNFVLADAKGNISVANPVDEHSSRVFGTHPGVVALFKDSENRNFYSVSGNALIKVWDYQSLEFVSEVNAPVSEVRSAGYFEKEKIFLFGDSTVAVFNMSSGFMVEGLLDIEAIREIKNFDAKEAAKKISALEKPEEGFRKSNNLLEELSAIDMTEKARLSIHQSLSVHQLDNQSPLQRRHSDIVPPVKKDKAVPVLYTGKYNYLITMPKSNSLIIWDLNEGLLKLTLNFRMHISHITVDDSEDFLWLGFSNGVIRSYNLHSLKAESELRGSENEVVAITTSKHMPDCVFVSSKDSNTYVWSIKDTQRIGKLHTTASNGGRGSGSNRVERLPSMGGITTSDLHAPSRSKLSSRVKILTISPDGSRLYALTKFKIYFWDISATYLTSQESLPSRTLNDYAVSHSDSNVLYGIGSKHLFTHMLVKSDVTMRSEKYESRLTAMALSSDDSLIALGNEAGQVEVIHSLDFSSKIRRDFSQSKIFKLQFYKSSKLFVSSTAGSFYMFDIPLRKTFSVNGNFGLVNQFLYIEERNWLLTSSNDNILRLWNLDKLLVGETPNEIWHYTGQAEISFVQYNPMDELVYFVEENSVLGFDVRSKECILNGIGNKDTDAESVENKFNISLRSDDNEFENDEIEVAYPSNPKIIGLEILHEFNLMLVVREPNDIAFYDLSTNQECLRWKHSETLVKIQRPYKSHYIFCETESRKLIKLDPFSPTFLEKCYIQTMSDVAQAGEFKRNLRLFKDHYHLIFLNKIIHPVTFAYLLNEADSLDFIVKNYGFPDQYYFQKSSLNLALKERNISFLEALCSALIRSDQQFTFGYSTTRMLFATEYAFIKRLLATKCFEQIQCFTNTQSKIPKFHFMKNSHNILSSLSGNFTKHDLDQLVISDKAALVRKNTKATVTDSHTSSSNNPLRESLLEKRQDIAQVRFAGKAKHRPKQNRERSVKVYRQLQTKKSEIEVFRINGLYNFNIGTADSLNFLLSYSESRIKTFILSDFKKIIQIKWANSHRFFYTLASIYWAYSLTFTIFLFNQYNEVLFSVVWGLIFSLMLYEFIPLVLFTSFYFKDVYNTLDLFSYGLAVVVLIMTYKTDPVKESWLCIMQVLSEVMIWYRALSYFRIFKFLRHVPDMIHKLAGSTFDILFIIAFLVSVSTVITSIAAGYTSLTTTFLGVIFVPFNEFPDHSAMSWFEIIVLMAEIYVMSLIIMNYLIANMSNKYAELVERQKMTHYREMAKLLFETEIWYKIFFRSKDTSKYVTYLVNDIHRHHHEQIDDNAKEETDEENDEMMTAVQAINDRLTQLDGRFAKIEKLINNRMNAMTGLQSIENLNLHDEDMRGD